MIFVSHYDSPLGILYLAADEEALKGVWFEGQKYFASGLKENGTEEKETPVLKRTRESGWIFILQGKIRSFFHRWRRTDQNSGKRSGSSCLRSHTGRR